MEINLYDATAYKSKQSATLVIP